MFEFNETREHLSPLLISDVLGWSKPLVSGLMKYVCYGIDSLKDLQEPGDDEVINHCVFPHSK